MADDDMPDSEWREVALGAVGLKGDDAPTPLEPLEGRMVYRKGVLDTPAACALVGFFVYAALRVLGWW